MWGVRNNIIYMCTSISFGFECDKMKWGHHILGTGKFNSPDEGLANNIFHGA